MRTGHSNSMTVPHKLAQHFRTTYNRYARLAGGNNFWILLVHSAGTDHNINTVDVFCPVADKNLRAHSGKALGGFRNFDVGAGNFITLIEQYFGNTAHTSATDTDKMNFADATHFRHIVNFRASHGRPPCKYPHKLRSHRALPLYARLAPFPAKVPVEQ